MKLPRAILFDLDDTIPVAFGLAQLQWRRTIAAFAARIGPIRRGTNIGATASATRRRIVATAFAASSRRGLFAPDPDLISIRCDL